MNPTLKVGRALKAHVMLWTDVSCRDLERMDQTESVGDLERALSAVLHIDLPEPRRGVLLDLYVQTLLFCRQRRFTTEQTSAVLSIVRSVHQANVETPLDNVERCCEYCRELLLCHSVRRPPFSVDLFRPEEATGVLTFVFDSYIRHHKLYKYVFTPQVKLDLSLDYSGIEAPGECATDDSSAPADAEDTMREEGAKTDECPAASVPEPEAETSHT